MARDDFTDIYAPVQIHQANAGVKLCEHRYDLSVSHQYYVCLDCREVISARQLKDRAKAEQGTKHDEGKPPLSMVSRELLEKLAEVRAFGAKKYARGNWKLGFKYTRSIDAALRHISAFNSGENNDSESGLTHIAHAIACLEHLLHDHLYRPENDDR